jgi:hypothetical protein
VLERKIRKKPTTPVEGETWLTLPMILFDREDATKVVEMVQSQLAAGR